jgi:anti-sigma regulatory factor (Ser/Thr protein kinase)
VVGSIPALRHEVHDVARAWALSPDEIEVALLIVNELVSNVVDHARTACRVTIRLDRSMVRIFVSDFCPAAPVLRAHNVHALRGRGMQIVAGLARRWGWNRHRAGKTVWASIDRASTQPQPSFHPGPGATVQQRRHNAAPPGGHPR